MSRKVNIAASKKLRKKTITLKKANLYLIANFNNTILTLTDEKGNAVKQVSCGTCGFNNTKKSTPHASQTAILHAIDVATKEFGVEEFSFIIRGPGPGREMVSIITNYPNIKINSIDDQTCQPYNGTRPRRRRRV